MLSRLSSVFPRIAPVRSYRDRVYGMVDVYLLTNSMWRRVFKNSSNGAQAQYFANNAKICDPHQFGIKLTGQDPQDAYAAWWRQRQAYKARLAPPVHRMVRFELIGKSTGTSRNRLDVLWGYQTGVAITMTDRQRDASGSGSLMECMMAYYGDANMAREIDNYRGRLVPRPIDLPSLTGKDIRLIGHHFGTMLDEIERDGNDRDEWEGFSMQTQEWVKALRHLDLRGSPRDNSITVDAISKMEDGDLRTIPKGATMRKNKHIRGGGDLHYGNVGWWRFGNRWHTVCIDFGWHYVCNHVRVARAGRWHTEQYNDCV